MPSLYTLYIPLDLFARTRLTVLIYLYKKLFKTSPKAFIHRRTEDKRLCLTMNILAIDTTSEHYSLSIALANGFTYDYEEAESWKHAELLLEKIKNIYSDFDQLDFLAIARGPGSFTGIRIGLSVAKGFKLALPNLKILTPTNFQIMANKAFDNLQKKEAIVIIDAKRDELVLQNIDSSLSAIDEMKLLDSANFNAALYNKTIVTDSPLVKLQHPAAIFIDKINSRDVLLTAIKIQDQSPCELEPIYFRKPDAKPSKIL